MSQTPGRFSRFFNFFKSSVPDNKSQQSSSLSAKTTFDRIDTSAVSQFDGYLSGIPLDIRRMRNKKQTKSVTFNSVRMELLQKCYREIPAIYFENQNKFDFGLFNRSKRKSQESQENIEMYLDQVELCLFNQVTSRFDEFVAVLRTIEALDLLVKDNLVKVGIMKNVSKHTQKNMLKKADVILDLTKKKANREKVLEKLLILKKARDSKEEIKTKITSERDWCLAVINEIKQNKQKVKQLKCAANYQKWQQQCQQVVKRDFTQNFSQYLYKYITLNTLYDKTFWQQLALRKDLLIKVEDLSNSTVLFEDELQPEHRRMLGVEISQDMEDKIVQIVVNGWSNGELGIAAAKSSLEQHFIEEFENILTDVREFSYQRLVEAGEGNFDKFNTESLLQHMSIEFYSRVLEFYSMMLKRYFRRLFSVCKKCVNQLIQISVNAQGWEIQRLQSIMESLFNIQLFVTKSNMEKFMKLVNLKKLGANIDFYRFRSYLGVIQTWQNYFTNQVSLLYNQIHVPTESPIKQRFYILKNKLNARQITESKNQVIELFFNNLHRNVINFELKKSLEDDSWQVVDIPTSFYQPIGLLLSGESWSPKKKNQNNTLESSLFVDRETSHRNRSIVKNIDIEQKSNLTFKLIKNECIVNGKMYKFTETFLLLIEILEEYVRIHDSFSNISEQVSAAILKLSGYYNSYSFKLIVEAGAVHFQKLKTKNITARHLAVSALCLEFLLLILDALSKKIKFHNYLEVIENIKNHHNEIARKLRAILQVKTSKSLADITLNAVPSPGSLSIINAAKALHDIISEFYSGPQFLSKVFDVELFNKYIEHLGKLEVKTMQKAETLKEEVAFFFDELQFLSAIIPEYVDKRNEVNGMIMRVFEAF